MRISIQKCKVSGSDSWIYRLRMKDNDRERYEHTEQPNIECYDLVDDNCDQAADDGQPCWDTIRKVFCEYFRNFLSNRVSNCKKMNIHLKNAFK